MKQVFIALILMLSASMSFAQISGDKHPPCLPITLSSFVAVPSGNGVELKWTTSSEINNYGFYVEKLNGVDYTLLTDSFRKGAGNSIVPQNYSYLSTSAGTFRLRQIDMDGTISYSDAIALGTTGTKLPGDITESTLSQNYPNPFNPSTIITYTLPVSTNVKLAVYDVTGKEVQILVNAYQGPGPYTVHFVGTGLASGSYYYILQTGNTTQKKKMLLMK
jgi:hypothetical protein